MRRSTRLKAGPPGCMLNLTCGGGSGEATPRSTEIVAVNRLTFLTRSKSVWRIPARESGRNFTWKSLMISFASRTAKRPRAWAWDLLSPVACCKAWAARSGSRANSAQAANFLFSSPRNQFRALRHEETNERTRQYFAGG